MLPLPPSNHAERERILTDRGHGCGPRNRRRGYSGWIRSGGRHPPRHPRAAARGGGDGHHVAHRSPSRHLLHARRWERHHQRPRRTLDGVRGARGPRSHQPGHHPPPVGSGQRLGPRFHTLPMNRRGTGLLEAVIASALTALLMVAALGALSSLQRSTGRFASRALSDQVIRGATQLIRSELRDISPAAGEILAFTPSSITYRAVRGTGISCVANGGRIQVISGTWAPLRQPAAGRDSLVILGQPPDTEVVVSSLGATATGFCPDGVVSMSLPYAVGASDPAAAARYPSPVLVTEVMELRGYESGGEWWIGARSVSAGEVIQPALGPIAGNGLRIVAFDSARTPTNTPRLVSHLLFVIRVPSGDSAEVHLDLSKGAWR